MGSVMAFVLKAWSGQLGKYVKVTGVLRTDVTDFLDLLRDILFFFVRGTVEIPFVVQPEALTLMPIAVIYVTQIPRHIRWACPAAVAMGIDIST